MELSTIFAQFNNARVSAVVICFGGPSRFRDQLTLGRNGRVYFERYNMGEAAGLVFSMWGRYEKGGHLVWDDGKVAYSGKKDAPGLLTGLDENGFYFDDKRTPWRQVERLKHWPKGGLGWFSTFFSQR